MDGTSVSFESSFNLRVEVFASILVWDPLRPRDKPSVELKEGVYEGKQESVVIGALGVPVEWIVVNDSGTLKGASLSNWKRWQEEEEVHIDDYNLEET